MNLIESFTRGSLAGLALLVALIVQCVFVVKLTVDTTDTGTRSKGVKLSAFAIIFTVLVLGYVVANVGFLAVLFYTPQGRAITRLNEVVG